MAAPNIVNVTNILGRTVGAALGTSSADILTNGASSNKVFKVNAIYVANIDGTADADVTVGFFDSSASATFRLAFTVRVPADSTLDLLSKSIYLEEGDKITALASASGDLEIVVSYEEIS